MNEHLSTLNYNTKTRMFNGELTEATVESNEGIGVKRKEICDYVVCKSIMSTFSVEDHFKTKKDLNNVAGVKTKSTTVTTTINKYCKICNTRYQNKDEHFKSDLHKENVSEKKLFKEEWKRKVEELGLDHTMSYNQISISSSDYNHANTLEAFHKLHHYYKLYKEQEMK